MNKVNLPQAIDQGNLYHQTITKGNVYSQTINKGNLPPTDQ